MQRRDPGKRCFLLSVSFLSRLVDDGPAIAEIIQALRASAQTSAFLKMAQEGFRLCQRRPPAEFLKVSESKQRNSSQDRATKEGRLGRVGWAAVIAIETLRLGARTALYEAFPISGSCMANPFEAGTHKREISGLTASGAAHEGRGCPLSGHVFSYLIFSLILLARPFHKRSAQDNFRMMQCLTRKHIMRPVAQHIVCCDGGIWVGMHCLHKSSKPHPASTPPLHPADLEFQTGSAQTCSANLITLTLVHIDLTTVDRLRNSAVLIFVL